MIKSTYRFKKRPDKYLKEEHDLVIKSNLLEFLAQLEIIDIDLWEEVAGPIEYKLGEFVASRGLVKGTI